MGGGVLFPGTAVLVIAVGGASPPKIDRFQPPGGARTPKEDHGVPA